MGFKKLDSSTIARIRELREQGYSHDDIVTQLGVSKPSAIKYSKDVESMTAEEITHSIHEGDSNMAKPRFSVDKLLTKAAEEAVESVIEKRLEPEEPIPFETVPPTAIESFFGDNGEPSAIKVYKLFNGGVRFLSEIEPDIFKGWEDFETGFRNYIQLRSLEGKNNTIWGDGVYQVKFRDKVRRIELGALVMPEQKIMTVKPPSVSEKMDELSSVVKVLKELTPTGSNEQNIYKVLFENQKSELELLRSELRELRERKTDINDEIQKALSLAKLVKGGGDSSPWLDAIKSFAPEIIGVAKDIANTLAMRQTIPSPMKALSVNPTAPVLPAQYQGLFTELRGYILGNDTSKFPHITRQLVGVFGGDDSLIKSIASGETSSIQLIDLLKMYGGEPFKEAGFQEALTRFVDAYTKWTKTVYPQSQPNVSTQPKQVDQPSQPNDNRPASTSQPAPHSVPYVTVRCGTCGVYFDVDKNDWLNDDKVCGNRLLNGECAGVLEEVKIPEA